MDIKSIRMKYKALGSYPDPNDVRATALSILDGCDGDYEMAAERATHQFEIYQEESIKYLAGTYGEWDDGRHLLYHQEEEDKAKLYQAVAMALQQRRV